MVKRRKLRDPCVHCGAPATTDDHVPPRVIFPKRAQSAPVKVPSCGPCNKGASIDDEYFGIVVAQRDREGKQPADAIEVSQRMRRALNRPGSWKLAAAMARDSVVVMPRSQAGLLLPPESWTRVNMDRVERVLRRVVRGLYWKKTGERLPPDVRVAAYDFWRLTVEQFRELDSFDWHKWDGGQLGTKVFAYKVARMPALGEHGTIWVIGLYGTIDFVVVTGSPTNAASATT